MVEKTEKDEFPFSIEDPFDQFHNPGKHVRFKSVGFTTTMQMFKHAAEKIAAEGIGDL